MDRGDSREPILVVPTGLLRRARGIIIERSIPCQSLHMDLLPEFAMATDRSSRLSRLSWFVFALILLVFLQSATSAWAWGRLGHRVISRLAERHLTPPAKAAIAELLEPGESLADASLWADENRRRSSRRRWRGPGFYRRPERSGYNRGRARPAGSGPQGWRRCAPRGAGGETCGTCA